MNSWMHGHVVGPDDAKSYFGAVRGHRGDVDTGGRADHSYRAAVVESQVSSVEA